MSVNPENINKTARDLVHGRAMQNSDNADLLYRTAEAWDLPQKLTRDGMLVDISRAKDLAKDKEKFREAFGHSHPMVAATLAGEGYEKGRDAGVDDVLERSAGVDNERAGPVDANTVQAAVPIEVDPLYVDIQQNEAPFLDLVQFEGQNGFTAQYNAIVDRAPPIGRVDETDSLDLSDNSKGDYDLGTQSEDMKIYVDQIEVSTFTQQATDSLGSGSLDVTETATGQRLAVHARYTAGEMLYGDPGIKSDGSIQGDNAAPGLARIATDRDSNGDESFSHVKDKSGFSGSGDQPLLEDLKSELTELVTNTGASYSDIGIVTSGEFFDTLENEGNAVTRLGSFDEGMNFGGRQINLKQDVPVNEIRAVGRTEHGQYDYNGTGDTPAGNFDPDPGDVFFYDRSTFRHRQLAPLSTVPLGRDGLADKVAMYEFSTNIDKSLGAHTKYLQGYPTA